MTRRSARAVGVAGLLAVTLALLAACGDDDTASDKVCDARDDLDQDVDELQNLDLSDTSINDVQDILGNISSDLSTLRDAGDEKLSPEIDGLNSSVDALGTAVAGLGSSASLADARDTLQAALGDVADAADELKTAAADDCD